MGANIVDMVFLERKPDFYRIKVEVHVSDVEHLLNIITSIEADTDEVMSSSLIISSLFKLISLYIF